MSEPLVCTPKRLPDHKLVEAATLAIEHNPANRPAVRGLVALRGGPTIEDAVMLTTKYWGAGGVHLAVGFIDDTPPQVQERILQYANMWSKTANIKFTLSNTAPQVRISTGPGGYWSYLGMDILTVPANEQTMNLEGIDLQTSDQECRRIIPHEFGHTLGMPHEHMRREEVAKLKRNAVIRYYMQTQGWSQREVIAQVLTPLEDADFLLATKPDQRSIMCYQIPGQLTKDGKPILGGLDIDDEDYALVSLLYPVQVA
jgi:hypothetical protein